jgi:glycosyltransferase involved in cell wall biosynthesis
MRVALVHDWLTGMRGGERVLEQMLQVYPDATVFTLLHDRGSVSERIERARIEVSPIARWPGMRSRYRSFLPFFPRAIEAFDLHGYDLILSSSHCVAKGAFAPGVPHVCYCHTPMRYLYDQAAAYAAHFSWSTRAAFALMRPRLRAWDVESAKRVTQFIANSQHVRGRIQSVYRRAAQVLHPPVDVDRFSPAAAREDFYLTVSALVPYKRIDLIVDAFTTLGRRLIVAGSGPELQRLRARAGRNITFIGWITDAEVADLLGRCRGFVYAAQEDFGIALVEAQAAGAPVIAFAAGGALESVVASGAARTGVLFPEQTAQAIVAAVLEAERTFFRAESFPQNAARFRPELFRAGLQTAIEQVLARPEAALV